MISYKLIASGSGSPAFRRDDRTLQQGKRRKMSRTDLPYCRIPDEVLRLIALFAPPKTTMKVVRGVGAFYIALTDEWNYFGQDLAKQ